jgi:hypothetical protein
MHTPSAPTDSQAPTRGPNCYDCKHFAVSWDASLPYTCRLMGFKSRGLPAVEVLRADGVFCRGFASKSATSKAAPTEPGVRRIVGARPAEPDPVIDKKPRVSRRGPSVWSA